MSRDLPTDDLLQKIAQYLENYIDLADNVPNDLIRQISQLHEKNHYFHNCLHKLEKALECSSNGGDKKNFLVVLHKCLADIQVLSDEKLNLSQSIYDILETKQRSLEYGYRCVTSSNGNHAISPVKASVEMSRNFYAPKQGLSSAYSHPVGNIQAADEDEAESSVNGGKSFADKEPDATPTSATKIMSPAKATKTLKRHPKPKEIVVSKRGRRERESSPTSVYDANHVDPDEPTYCLCAQVSYGDMIGCDNTACPIEWFHFSCVNLSTKPKGN